VSGSKFVHPISYLVVAFASCYTLLSLVGIEMEGTNTAATSQQASHFSCNPWRVYRCLLFGSVMPIMLGL
jgi:hypothetical protein